jgi:alpha-glucosidase (family GH31 glycosyl hydrolase)
VLFEDKNYMIEDAKGTKVFKVQMKGKSFVLDFMNEEHAAIYKENNNLML